MFKKKQICSKCKVGKENYEVDPGSVFCQHIECLKNGRCSKFEPIKRENKFPWLKIFKMHLK